MKKYSPNSKPNRRRGISLAAALVVLFLLFHPRTHACTIALEPDTNIVKYELNDPRNPDCPCHAAQKLADQEYERLQHQNDHPVNQETNPADHNPADNTVTNTNSDVHSNSSSGSPGSGSQKHYSASNKSMKKIMKWTKRMQRKLGKKNNGTKKGKHRLANCFQF